VSNYTGLSPSMAPRSRGLRRHLAKSFLYKLQLGPKPDFKFELLPLHSPLLGQSLLVSFPPLIDMLKFSGYSYLIRGQHFRSWVFYGRGRAALPVRVVQTTAHERLRRDRHCISGPGSRLRGSRSPTPDPRRGSRVEMTLGQACPPEYWRAQCAFKDSMIH
jgi:hypothetical protein